MTTAIPTRALTDPTRAFISVGCTIFLLLAAVAPAAGQSLRGSGASLDRQNRAARRHDFTYIDTANRIRYFADQGWLVRVRPTRDYALHAVSYPYARPELALFVRRLAGQYRSACGEQLVVTSLTRPTTRQPRNASDRSVHPTGMAVDLRYSPSRRCRGWLEQVLLSLERAGVIEATRERYPAHYHVAVFPREYSAYVDQLIERERADPPVRVAAAHDPYTVRPGDSLWTIAREYGTSVDELRTANNLRGSRIYEGQVLEIPRGR
jgi:hypothetical protein